MISSGNLLLFYLGLELSTIPLAALANFDLDRRSSSEAGDEVYYLIRIFIGFIVNGYFIYVWHNRNYQL
jgi:NADH:ubiquinone oxidoreductase subunit 2 (subunit N)